MIDPNAISTIRVGQLVEAPFNLSDNIPHEVGTYLKRGTIGDLATFIAGIIGSSDDLAFLPISVTNGQTLPDTTKNEWFLAGKGTYHQSGGFPDIICTQELNAIIGNGTNWILGVEIPIIIDPLSLSGFVKQVFLKRYLADGQDYALPTGATATFAYIDGYLQYLEQTGFESDLNTFTQAGNVITFKTTIETNSQILINHYL